MAAIELIGIVDPFSSEIIYCVNGEAHTILNFQPIIKMKLGIIFI